MEPPRINLTSDLRISQRAYRTSTTSEAEINKQVQNLLAAGLIKESNSCYSSPVTLAYKRDEKQKTRLCIDYRKLNAICKTDAEPLPRIDSLLDKLNSAKYFSTLDLTSGYWHILFHDKDKEKLAFVTTEDLYEFLSSSFFGFRNAPAIFNRTILTKFPPAYLLFGTLPSTPPLAQNQVYPPVEEARKLAKENTIKYHEKNKIKYDARVSLILLLNRVTS
ncbi:retrovirus-related Pol polyprotein from transposon 297 [Trichonephila clavipes]|nr:retrovirus-related Pol polyprotein from transposon 297 [Trichonephila clavipes]